MWRKLEICFFLHLLWLAVSFSVPIAWYEHICYAVTIELDWILKEDISAAQNILSD
jgi:hypothetical protein